MELQLTMFDEFTTHQVSHAQIIKQLQLSASYSDKIFYPPKEVAEMLGLSYFQVFSAIRMYRLDAIRVGAMWRIPWTAIIRFIEEDEYREDLERSYGEWVKARGGA